MMKKESSGERIRARRKALQLTQQTLAKGIGVSHVAVSQWEKEETVPRGENLLRLAEWLQCTAAWIIDGDGEVFTAAPRRAPVTAVPLISLAQASEWLSEARLLLQQQATHFLYREATLSDAALAVTVEDQSMLPDYRPGDALIFDPQVAPQPGDTVLALVDGAAMVRFYRLQTQQHDEKTFALRPANDDFPHLHTATSRLEIIGTLMELRRYRSR
ncbi:S24 family peptidase [Pantoea sp. NPDC088449]|uniref:S24 family peptidase n=1 Tax=unclassified Pantoea TaxID=2630326 RepID=UPI0031F4AAFB